VRKRDSPERAWTFVTSTVFAATAGAVFKPEADGSSPTCGAWQSRQRASYISFAPAAPTLASPVIFWDRDAGRQQTTHTAWSFVTLSATARSFGIGPKGWPRKSISRTAQITRIPR